MDESMDDMQIHVYIRVGWNKNDNECNFIVYYEYSEWILFFPLIVQN